MARIFPFAGVRYEASEDLSRVVAPPYDVITPQQQEALYEASEHNIVRIELTRREEGQAFDDSYRQAAKLLRHWLKAGILAPEEAPSYYIYRQTYALPGGGERTRTGFFASVQLEEFSSGIIRPHEETFSGPKEDRLRLLRACRANTSPIFGLYQDSPTINTALERGRASQSAISFRDSAGVRHQLWVLRDPAVCDLITRAMVDRSILIADGHHRYETALAYRRERRGSDDLWPESTLFVLVSMSDPGLTVLPTHRILRDLERSDLSEWKVRVEQLPGAVVKAVGPEAGTAMLSERGEGNRFVLVLADGSWLITLPRAYGTPLEQLDIYRLHRELLPALIGAGEGHTPSIDYTADAEAAIRSVRQRAAAGAVLVRPTPVDQVDRVAASGARMPEKSTYFYPKLPTGLVLRVDPVFDESGP